MGFAASHQAWAPQIADLLSEPTHGGGGSSTGGANAGGRQESNGAAEGGDLENGTGAAGQPPQQQPVQQQQSQQPRPSPMVVCVLDNRGVGRSSSPEQRAHYSTAAMAADARQVLDHLGWRERVHLVGHSMGAMIALKLAAAAPQRVASLSVLSATGGGWQAVPKTWSSLWLGVKASRPLLAVV